MGLESKLDSGSEPFASPIPSSIQSANRDGYGASRMERAQLSGENLQILLEGLYWFVPIAGDVQAHMFFKNKRDKSPTPEEQSLFAVREAVVIGGKYLAEISIAAGMYLL